MERKRNGSEASNEIQAALNRGKAEKSKGSGGKKLDTCTLFVSLPYILCFCKLLTTSLVSLLSKIV